MSYLRNNKVLLLVITVLLLANIGLIYFSFWRKHPAPDKPMREDVRTKLIKEIGLDSIQTAQYDTLRKTHFETIRPMFSELRKHKDSLYKMIHQPAIPDSVITVFSNDIFQKQMVVDLKIHRYFRLIKDICNEEQKVKMDSFLIKMANRMSWGNRRGPGPDMKNKK